MSDFFDVSDIIGKMIDNVSDDIKTFDDLVNLKSNIDRKIFINDIDAGTGSFVNEYISFWNKIDEEENIPIQDRKPIKMCIDSCGGSLLDTFTIIDSIKLSKTPVWTIVTGCAYSGGFFIAITGHKRFSYPHASFLFHEGSTSTGGTSSQFENYSMFYKKRLQMLGEHTLKYTKIGKDKYEEKKKEDWWIDVDEALELGIIDEITETII